MLSTLTNSYAAAYAVTLIKLRRGPFYIPKCVSKADQHVEAGSCLN